MEGAGLAVQAIVVAFSLFMLALNGMFLRYVSVLQESGCHCALGWRRTFMEVALIIFITFTIIGLTGWQSPIVGLLLFMLSIAFIIVTRQFIHHIKNAPDCSCADLRALKWLNIVNWAQIITLSIYGVVLLAAIIIGFASMRNLSTIKTSRGSSKRR